MKITSRQLRKIIREQIEDFDPYPPAPKKPYDVGWDDGYNSREEASSDSDYLAGYADGAHQWEHTKGFKKQWADPKFQEIMSNQYWDPARKGRYQGD